MEKALSILNALKESGCFVGDIDEALAELEEAQLTRREWYQKGYNEAMKPKTCKWKLSNYDYNLWVGKCGAEWTLIDGTPTENHMKFCPECGGKLIEIEPKDNA